MIDDWDLRTQNTYNESAEGLAKYFDSIGPRVVDIEMAFDFIQQKPNARVIELGCGNGRDASYIIQKTNDYLGVDQSTAMVALAQQRLPQAQFVAADMVDYRYPKDVDLCIAFASIHHLNKMRVVQLLHRITNSIKKDGIFYFTTKNNRYLDREFKVDGFGSRMFYYYGIQELQRLAKPAFQCEHYTTYDIGGTPWMTGVFRRVGEE